MGFSSLGNTQYFNAIEETFEGSPTVHFDNGAGVNHFIVGTCAGNSSASAGSLYSLYVAPNTGVSNGCNMGSDESYAYMANASGKDTILAYIDVPTSTCVQGDMILNFDYKMETNDLADYAVVVYRLNPTDSWSVLTSLSTPTNTWLQANYTLPSTLNAQDFQLGFYFIFNDNSTAGIPLAIDNIIVKGLDVVDPVITCPGVQNLYGDITCSSVLPKYTSLVTASDNCSPVGNLLYTQSPDMGEIATGTTTITITVFDMANNSASCTFDVEMIDTIAPVLTCNEFHNISNNNSCTYLMPDLSGDVIQIDDNCSTSGFTITQSIIENTSVNGIQNVFVYVEDEQGNQGSCVVRVVPEDNIAPTVICPNDTTINNGVNCDYTVADFTGLVVATDNCTITSIVQVPVQGDIIYTGTTEFSIRVTDESGNYSDCTFEALVIENVDPQITFCPSDITTCDPEVTFPPVTATDNCGFDIIKTDLSNLNSGDFFPIGVTQMQYTAKDQSGNTAECNFEITILPSPEEPTLVDDEINLCNETTATIAAEPVTVGTGYWSLPTGSTLTINDVNDPITTVTNLESGENIIYWNTTSTNCGNNQVALKVINAPLPSQATIAKDTTYKCNENNLLLSADIPTSGQGLWSSNDPENTIANANNHNAIATNIQGGWNTFYYTVSSGICPSTVDSLIVYKTAYPEILSFQDTTFCEKIDLELIGSTPPEGISTLWYFNKGKGSFSQEDSTTTFVTEYQRGYNEIIYAFNNPHCGWTYDTITLTFNACNGDEFIIPTLITPNQDGKNDAFIIEGLNDTYPNCQVTIVNRWGGIVFKSNGYENPWNGMHKGKPVQTGTYYYVIELNDGSNKSLNGPISVIR